MSIEDLSALHAIFDQKTNNERPKHADRLPDLLEAVAAGDGLALLDDLLAEGFPPDLIRSALEPGEDKRQRPKLLATSIGPWRVLSLSSSGFAAVGEGNRRPALPTASTLLHRLGPKNARARLEERVAPVARERGVMLDVISGGALRAYCEDRRGEAWSLIKGNGGAQDANDASVVLSGVLPDFLVLETWHESMLPRRPQIWPSSGDPVALIDPQPAEFLTAVEIETSPKFSAEVLGLKVRRSTIAQRLGWWQATCWATGGEQGQDINERLRRVGVLTHPGHYFLPASALGIGGPTVAPPAGARLPWWLEVLTN